MWCLEFIQPQLYSGIVSYFSLNTGVDFLILFYESNSVPSILTSIPTSLGRLQPSDEAECMFH